MGNKKVTIVVPVYADWDSLKECIESLKQYVHRRHRLLLINYCGPEVDILEEKIKKIIKDRPNFKYYRNPENLGFVKTCNRAVTELDKTSNNILLLNSDTKVTKDFLEEMLNVLSMDNKIGAVSPRSNNATIATVPLSEAAQKGIDPRKSYEIFMKLRKRLPRYNEIPTALGFCMLIRRTVINKFGLFDNIFGKGYGEENDFSMRIKKGGYISVLSNRSYVFHLEARSFTMKTKLELIKKNRAIIDKRYPNYGQLVRDYISEALLREEGNRLKRLYKNPLKLIRRFTGHKNLRSILPIKKSRAMVLGVLAVILLYISIAGMVSITTPWYIPKQNDTNRHVDYVWRIYNGQIPKYTDRVTYPPFLEKGYSSSQNAAANPPLYYIIHAPFVGPYLNAGKWEKAIAIGRTINLAIGVLCVLALSWAGWVYGGRRRELFAVSVAALSTMTFLFLRLNRYYALDALVVLIGTLNLIVLRKMLEHGLRRKYIIPLALLSVAGMATKSTYIVILFTSLIAVIMAAVIKDNKIKLKSILRGSYISGMILALVIVSIGWFYYYWNYKASGDLFRAVNNKSLDTSRPYKSLFDVLTSAQLWSLFYARLTQIPVISTAITSFAVAGIILKKDLKLSILYRNRAVSWSILLLISVFLGTIFTQIVLATGYGSISFRYLFPAIFPIGLFLAYGLLEFDRLKGQMVSLAAILMAGTTLIGIRVSPTEENLLTGVNKWRAGLSKIIEAATENGVPVLLTKSLLLLFAIGAILLPIAMFYLHQQAQANLRSKT